MLNNWPGPRKRTPSRISVPPTADVLAIFSTSETNPRITSLQILCHKRISLPTWNLSLYWRKKGNYVKIGSKGG